MPTGNTSPADKARNAARRREAKIREDARRKATGARKLEHTRAGSKAREKTEERRELRKTVKEEKKAAREARNAARKKAALDKQRAADAAKRGEQTKLEDAQKRAEDLRKKEEEKKQEESSADRAPEEQAPKEKGPLKGYRIGAISNVSTADLLEQSLEALDYIADAGSALAAIEDSTAGWEDIDPEQEVSGSTWQDFNESTHLLAAGFAARANIVGAALAEARANFEASFRIFRESKSKRED